MARNRTTGSEFAVLVEINGQVWILPRLPDGGVVLAAGIWWGYGVLPLASALAGKRTLRLAAA